MSKRKRSQIIPSAELNLEQLSMIFTMLQKIPTHKRSNSIGLGEFIDLYDNVAALFNQAKPTLPESQSIGLEQSDTEDRPTKKAKKTMILDPEEEDLFGDLDLDSEPTLDNVAKKPVDPVITTPVKPSKKRTGATKKKKSVDDSGAQSKNQQLKRFAQALHPCGRLFISPHYKGQHTKEKSCPFEQELCQFPICICGYRLYDTPDEWEKNLNENGISQMCARMAQHASSCAVHKKYYAEFIKNLQLFTSNPHKPIKLYDLIYDYSDIDKEAQKVATDMAKIDNVFGCIGCWSIFKDDLELYRHLFDCQEFKDTLPRFAKEMWDSIFNNYIKSQGINVDDYAKHSGCAKFLRQIPNGEASLLPFADEDATQNDTGLDHSLKSSQNELKNNSANWIDTRSSSKIELDDSPKIVSKPTRGQTNLPDNVMSFKRPKTKTNGILKPVDEPINKVLPAATQPTGGPVSSLRKPFQNSDLVNLSNSSQISGFKPSSSFVSKTKHTSSIVAKHSKRDESLDDFSLDEIEDILT